MPSGRILLADDEEAFLQATATLLRRAGYACDTARDGAEAAGQLSAAHYDLLVADICMPGNTELDLLRHAAVRGRGMPVILVTGHPTLDTAIRSVELPVVAYLVKPLAFEQLEARVRAVMDGARAGRPGRAARDPAAFELFLATASRTILESLADLRHLSQALAGGDTPPEPCHLLNCPRLRQFKDAVASAIAVLEETKAAFKSRQLGDLRQQLERLLKEAS